MPTATGCAWQLAAKRSRSSATRREALRKLRTATAGSSWRVFALRRAGPGDGHAPANTTGVRHVAFRVDDLDAVVDRLRARGAELVGEVERYGDIFRLRYLRGPKGIIVELAERIG